MSLNDLSRKRILLIAAGVAAVCLIAVGSYLMGARSNDSAAEKVTANGKSAATGAAVGTNEEGGAGTISGTGANGGAKASASLSATQQAPGFITDKPRPTKPATLGAELKQLEVPPLKTVSGVRMPEGRTEFTYSVKFQVYGWGPDGPTGKRLIIYITSATPQSGVTGVADLKGANAVVGVSPQDVGLFERSGTFEGTIQVTKDSDGRSVMALEKARSAK